MKGFFGMLVIPLILYACQKDIDSNHGLAKYIDENQDFSISDYLIACASSTNGSDSDQVHIFFYPEPGAYEFKCFEKLSNGDVGLLKYNNYVFITEKSDSVFNGYLRKFNYPIKAGWVIVTYKKDAQLHISEPICVKPKKQPTLDKRNWISISDEDTEPLFSWRDEPNTNNIIYFQVISDVNGELITGTYTYDSYLKFGDYSNVVLNIKDQVPLPMLDTMSSYRFTLMGVGDDNWVNLYSQNWFFVP